MNEIFYPSHDGETSIHACIWRPAGEAKGVVQIIHGMCEYAKRYAPFAEFLTAHGYIVCAEDHLGHGASVGKHGLGYFNRQRSPQIVLDDIKSLQSMLKKEAGDKPYFVLGHSMGSFFCRKYISLVKGIDGAVIMGTGFKGKCTLNFALAFVRLNALFCGWKHKSKLIKKLAFGSYNKKFGSAAGENAWLSKDEDNVRAYEADPLCGFSFTNNGYNILFNIIKQACSKKTIASVPKELPVYFVAGADDPVGDYGKGVLKAKKAFVKAGVKDVRLKLYKEARHEILNDFCKDEVESDVLKFFDEIAEGGNG